MSWDYPEATLQHSAVREFARLWIGGSCCLGLLIQDTRAAQLGLGVLHEALARPCGQVHSEVGQIHRIHSCSWSLDVPEFGVSMGLEFWFGPFWSQIWLQKPICLGVGTWLGPISNV